MQLQKTTPPPNQVDFQEYVRWSQGASWSEQLLVRDDRDREARRLARVYGIHLLVAWIKLGCNVPFPRKCVVISVCVLGGWRMMMCWKNMLCLMFFDVVLGDASKQSQPLKIDGFFHVIRFSPGNDWFFDVTGQFQKQNSPFSKCGCFRK